MIAMPTQAFVRRIAVAAALATLSCRKHEIGAGVNDSTFVAAMASLRRLPPAAMLDSASRKRSRDSVLQHFHLTAAQMEQAATILARDPNRAAAIWSAIEKKQNTPR
jgi:hypothetical protein